MIDNEILGIVRQHPPEWHVCRCGKCKFAFAADGETVVEAEALIAALLRTVKETSDGNSD